MMITKHAMKRMKQRIGLPKRAFSKHLESVVRQGTWDLLEDNQTFKIIYKDFLYLVDFSRNLDPILITTYRVNSI